MTGVPPRVRTRVRPVQEPLDRPSVHEDRDAPKVAATSGYCRPPEAHRFRPGRSGNPKGRPKGTRNMATIIAEVLARPIRSSRDGVPKGPPIAPKVALVNVILAKALKGDRHAWATVLGWAAEEDASKEKRDAIRTLGEKEQAILERMKARLDRSGGEV